VVGRGKRRAKEAGGEETYNKEARIGGKKKDQNPHQTPPPPTRTNKKHTQGGWGCVKRTMALGYG